jgi:integration host factor subunit beta
MRLQRSQSLKGEEYKMIIRSQLQTLLTEQLPEFSAEIIDIAIDKIIATIVHGLEHGQRIEIRGFGSFTLRYCATYQMYNPVTKKKSLTLPRYKLYFRPGRDLRKMLQQS